MSNRSLAVAAVCLLLVGCRKAEQRDADLPPTPAPASASAPAQSQPQPQPQAERADAAEPRSALVEWSKLVGRCVIVEGYATGGGKTAESLEGGSWSIGIAPGALADAGSFPSLRPGSRVRMRGVVAVRADRPVFVEKPGELPMQGIPVPEGTDLEQARRRYVLDKISVTPLRSAAEVERALTASIGKEVSLAGMVWSVNAKFWFNHDSVTVHVERHDKVSGFTSLHGKAVTLRGRLDRRPMPRIDQIVLKPKPDLAEAFVITLDEVKPHPESRVTPCEP